MKAEKSRFAKIRVFLVDDHPIVRRGFQYLLNVEADLMVCGEANNGREALQKILDLKPDVAIVDLSLGSTSGLELIKNLRAQRAPLKILVFTMRAESIYAERALRAGANGFITKEEGTERAIDAIRTIMQGKTCLSPVITESLMARMANQNSAPGNAVDLLSDRELEILEMIGSGLPSREIAGRLHLSIKTVESHREHIKSKLGLKGAPELVNYAYNWLRGN